jgi:hypothetical protein
MSAVQLRGGYLLRFFHVPVVLVGYSIVDFCSWQVSCFPTNVSQANSAPQCEYISLDKLVLGSAINGWPRYNYIFVIFIHFANPLHILSSPYARPGSLSVNLMGRRLHLTEHRCCRLYFTELENAYFARNSWKNVICSNFA